MIRQRKSRAHPFEAASERSELKSVPITNSRLIPSRILLVENDDLVAESLSAALANNGRDVTLCADPAGAAVLLDETSFDSVIADMHLEGPFTFDGLDIAALTKVIQPSASVVMITGFASYEAVEAARAYGARILAKPSEIDSLEEHLPETPPRLGRVVRLPSLEETIRYHLVEPHFQPIMRLGAAGAALYGLEALTRIDDALPLRTPEMLFRYAVERHAISAADTECLRRIFASIPAVERTNYFINVHPHSLTDAQLARNVLRLTRDAGVDLSRVIIEITEHDALPASASVRRSVAELHAAGVRFALDDIGMAHSHLAMIDCIRPSFFKISFDLGPLNSHSTRSALIGNLSRMGRDLGCEVIAERIETADDESMARELEIELVQGHRVGRPTQHPRFNSDVTI